jgi:hypothetical protein
MPKKNLEKNQYKMSGSTNSKNFICFFRKGFLIIFRNYFQKNQFSGEFFGLKIMESLTKE